MQLEARLNDLRSKLAASTNGDGKALKGYGPRVKALEAEIARITALPGTTVEPGLTDEPETA